MFRSYDHLQGAYFVPCQSYSLKDLVIYFVMLIWCCGSVSCVMRHTLEQCTTHLNRNFSKEQSMFPEDDHVIKTCRSILSVLM